MARRLFDLLTLLSLLLALAACAMWARSRFVTEGWEFKPRPAGMIYAGNGRYTYRLVESAEGRLVYAEYRWRNDFPMPAVSLPSPGYRRSAAPLTPALPGRLPNVGDPYLFPPGTVHGRIPAVAEWWSIPLVYRRRFVAVSWLAIAVAFAALPAARAGWRWRRRRQSARPAFPVIPSDPA
jgi:hypothetical protein